MTVSPVKFDMKNALRSGVSDCYLPHPVTDREK